VAVRSKYWNQLSQRVKPWSFIDPLSKRDSMEWRKPGEAPPRKAKVTQSAKKIMTTIFWDCRGILLIDFKERNSTVNAAYYASLLNKLRDAIKRRGEQC